MLKLFTLPVFGRFTILASLSLLAGCSQMFAGGVDEETNTVAGANPNAEDTMPEASATLTGTLTDAKGNPVAGAEVFAIACDSSSVVLSAITDESGHFGLSLDLQGEYGLSGSTAAGAFYSVVEYSGTPVNVNLKLTGTGSIKGRLDASMMDDGIVFTVVGSQWSSTTDMNGNFEIDGVPQGAILPVYVDAGDSEKYDDVVYAVRVGYTLSGAAEFSDAMAIGSYKGIVAYDTVSSANYITIKPTSSSSAEASSSSTRASSSSSVAMGGSSSSMVDLPVGFSSGDNNPATDSDTIRDTVNEPGTELPKDGNDGSSGNGLLVPYGVDYGVLGRFEMDSIQGGNSASILGAGALFDTAPALVVEGWVKVNSVASAPYRQNIVGVYPQQGGGAGLFTLAVIDGMCNVMGPHFAFFRGDASGSFTCGNVAVNPSAYRLGSWAYLTAVWDFDTGILVLYVDGEAVARAYSAAAPNRPTADPVNFGDAMLDLSLEQVRMGGRPLRVVDVRYRYNYYGGAR